MPSSDRFVSSSTRPSSDPLPQPPPPGLLKKESATDLLFAMSTIRPPSLHRQNRHLVSGLSSCCQALCLFLQQPNKPLHRSRASDPRLLLSTLVANPLAHHRLLIILGPQNTHTLTTKSSKPRTKTCRGTPKAEARWGYLLQYFVFVRWRGL